MSFSTSYRPPPFALLIHSAHLPAPTAFDLQGSEVASWPPAREGAPASWRKHGLKGHLGQREVWDWGLCAANLREWAGSTKNVFTTVRSRGPGALVSFSPAIVHFGWALASSSVGNLPTSKPTFPRRLCGTESEGNATSAALAQRVSWKGGRERGGVPAARMGGGGRAAAAPGRARVRGGDGGA